MATTITDSELYQLLDNGWQVQIWRQVDGRYVAGAKRIGETWLEIFEVVNANGTACGFPTDDFERAIYKGPRRPERIGQGYTPAAALKELAGKVLGG